MAAFNMRTQPKETGNPHEIIDRQDSKTEEFTMHKSILIFLALLIGAILLIMPVSAAPKQQNNLQEFSLNANTTISVTIAITGGQVIVVPVALNFAANNNNGTTDVSLLTKVDQQAGIFIGVAAAPNIDATIQLPGAASASTPIATRPAGANADGEGTHVANRNSNLRSGPGTNFGIVGRVPAGGTVTIVGENNDGTWLQLDDGSWIAEFLVDPIDPSTSNNAPDDTDSDDATPTPSPTPTATLTPAEAEAAAITAYLDEVASIAADTTATVDSLSTLQQNAQPLSPTWRNNVTTQLNALYAELDQYLALSPQAGYETLQTQITEVALACEAAADAVASSLQTEDTSVADQSLPLIQACASQAATLAANVEALP